MCHVQPNDAQPSGCGARAPKSKRHRIGQHGLTGGWANTTLVAGRRLSRRAPQRPAVSQVLREEPVVIDFTPDVGVRRYKPRWLRMEDRNRLALHPKRDTRKQDERKHVTCALKAWTLQSLSIE